MKDKRDAPSFPKESVWDRAMDVFVLEILPPTLVITLAMIGLFLVLGGIALTQALLRGGPDSAYPSSHYGSVPTYPLPDDLCYIDDAPMMPELDYIGYGRHAGLVLKYTNMDGDLVMRVDNTPVAVYGGDFCR